LNACAAMSLAADDVDQRRHPDMYSAFVQHAVVLIDFDASEILEGFFE
jgi:hypothetical protein